MYDCFELFFLKPCVAKCHLGCSNWWTIRKGDLTTSKDSSSSILWGFLLTSACSSLCLNFKQWAVAIQYHTLPRSIVSSLLSWHFRVNSSLPTYKSPNIPCAIHVPSVSQQHHCLRHSLFLNHRPYVLLILPHFLLDFKLSFPIVPFCDEMLETWNSSFPDQYSPNLTDLKNELYLFTE